MSTFSGGSCTSFQRVILIAGSSESAVASLRFDCPYWINRCVDCLCLAEFQVVQRPLKTGIRPERDGEILSLRPITADLGETDMAWPWLRNYYLC